MNEIETVRAEIPATGRIAYLNTASVGPVARIYAQALATATDEDLRTGRATGPRWERLDTAREHLRNEIAQLVGCRPTRIFLTQGTGAGLERVIDTIRWQRGGIALSTALEHDACAVPLTRRASVSDVTVRTVSPVGDPADACWLTDAITPKTQLVALSAVTFESGARLPVAEVAAAAAKAGVPTLIDAAQCAGAVPLDLPTLGVDFCALPLQKWLLGPEGLGALYVRSPDDPRLTEPPRDNTTHDIGVIAGAAATLEWLRTTIGWPWIHARTTALAEHARHAVTGLPGVCLVTPRQHAGITTIACSAARRPNAADTLAQRGFLVRHLPDLGAFRISTAFFNTETEIDAFLAAALDAGRQDVTAPAGRRAPNDDPSAILSDSKTRVS